MFFQRFEDLCIKNGSDVSNTLKALELSTSKGTAWKGGSIPKGDVLLKIAKHFNTSTDYLLGNTDDPTPPGQNEQTPLEGERKIDIGEVKVALFGGDGEVTDEMWNEVLFAVELAKERAKRKKEQRN